MRYERALEEFELEDDDGKSRLVYAYFGLAIYFGQVLEEALSHMLWMHRFFKQKKQTNEIINKIIDDIEAVKKTMGMAINEVKNAYSLPETLESALANVLAKRNYLAHRYFKDEIHKCYSESGQKEVIHYFCQFIDQTTKVDNALKPYYSKYIEALGVTNDKIDELMDQMIKQEKIRDIEIL
ncbi:MAG: hypothetical protein GWP10_20745 [Nitrospiraceae bacterium]|nr:hypothetical protein [Nitrospiraceae bacterium]